MGDVLSCPARVLGPKDSSEKSKVPVERARFSEYWAKSDEVLWQLWPAVIQSGIQTYTFSLYGNAINQIRGTFFDGSTTAAWASFSIPFFVRPFGGMFAGWLSDRYGRRKVIIGISYSVLLSTVAQGLIPGNLGLFGRSLLVSLRFIQGLSFGASSAMAVYAVEAGPKENITMAVTFVQTGSACGSLSAVLLFASLQTWLTSMSMDSWGWRFPHVLVLIPGLWSCFQMHQLQESPDFIASSQTQTAKTGFWESLQILAVEYPMQVMLYVGTLVSAPAITYVARVFTVDWMPRYAGISRSFVFWLICIDHLASISIAPTIAWMTDYYGPSKVLIAGNAISAATIVPLLALVLKTNHPYEFGVMLAIAFGAMNSLSTPVEVINKGFLPTHVRNMGAGLSTQVTICAFGGLSPMMLTWLIQHHELAPGMYLAGCFLMSMMSVVLAVRCREQGLKLTYLREEPF